MSESMIKQTMGISKLEKPLARCTVSSKYDIARLEKVARLDPADLPTIRIGVIDGRNYPMSGLDILEACKLAAVHEIRVETRQYETKSDLIIDQIKEISVGEHIDPLRIRGIVDDLGRYGISVDDALKKTNLQDTALSKIAKSDITDEALDMFAKFIEDELSDKLTARILVMPTHIPLRIGRLEPALQTEIARMLIEITPPGSGMNFTWPASDAVVHRIKNTPKPEVHADPVFVEPSKPDNGDLAVPEAGTTAKPKKSKKAKPKPVENDTLKDMQHVAKDCIVIIDKKGEPKMLVNKKDNTVKEISPADSGKAFKLHENTGKPAYLLPLELNKHLKLDSRSLHGHTFDDVESLVKFAKTIEGDGAKFSLLWTIE